VTLKLIALVLATIAAYAQFLLSYVPRFKDGRTTWHRRTRFAAQLLMIVMLPIGGLSVYFDDQDSAEARSDLKEMRAALDRIERAMGPQVSKMTPDQIATRIEDLQRRALRAERGVSDTFDFNGCRRVTARPGHISTNCGEEHASFLRMSELEKNKDWLGLAREAEAMIAKSPTWLTAYLELGVAKANLGDREAARAALQRVVDSAAGDPAYAHAAEILKQLGP
jgi:hypothetical protein